VKKAQETHLETMKKGGCNISPMPQGELNKWAEEMPNFALAFAKKVETNYGLPGKDLVKTYYENQSELGHKWAKDWTK